MADDANGIVLLPTPLSNPSLKSMIENTTDVPLSLRTSARLFVRVVVMPYIIMMVAKGLVCSCLASGSAHVDVRDVLNSLMVTFNKKISGVGDTTIKCSSRASAKKRITLTEEEAERLILQAAISRKTPKGVDLLRQKGKALGRHKACLHMSRNQVRKMLTTNMNGYLRDLKYAMKGTVYNKLFDLNRNGKPNMTSAMACIKSVYKDAVNLANLDLKAQGIKLVSKSVSSFFADKEDAKEKRKHRNYVLSTFVKDTPLDGVVYTQLLFNNMNSVAVDNNYFIMIPEVDGYGVHVKAVAYTKKEGDPKQQIRDNKLRIALQTLVNDDTVKSGLKDLCASLADYATAYAAHKAKATEISGNKATDKKKTHRIKNKLLKLHKDTVLAEKYGKLIDNVQLLDARYFTLTYAGDKKVYRPRSMCDYATMCKIDRNLAAIAQGAIESLFQDDYVNALLNQMLKERYLSKEKMPNTLRVSLFDAQKAFANSLDIQLTWQQYTLLRPPSKKGTGYTSGESFLSTSPGSLDSSKDDAGKLSIASSAGLYRSASSQDSSVDWFSYMQSSSE